MDAYKVTIQEKDYHGYPVYDLLWNGVPTVAKRGKRLYRIIDLWSGGFAINNRRVDCYDLEGAIDTALLDLVKNVQRKHPRSRITFDRLETEWV